MKKVLCLGDVGVDNYLNREEKYLGGCGLNVYLGLEGLDRSLMAPMGQDSYSEKIIRTLASESVYFPTYNGTCSEQKIEVHKNGEKKFIAFNEGVWSDWRASSEELEYINKYELVVSVLFEQNKNAFDSYFSKGSSAWAIDFMDLQDFSFEQITPYLKKSRYALFGLCDSSLKEQLIPFSFESEIIITNGEKGGLVLSKGLEHPFLSRAVKVVDSTGAGDSFFAGFLSARLTGASIDQSLELGLDRSTQVLSRYGANLSGIRL